MSFESFIMNENEYRTSTKCEAELVKLTLEENMSELKRSFHILTKGHQLQKYAIYNNLHNIFKEAQAIDILLPIINEDILDQDDDNLQITCANSIVKAIRNNNNIFNEKQLSLLMNLCLKMLQNWNYPTLDSWVTLFKEILNLMNHSLCEDQINKTVLLLSDKSQKSESRYISARMLGFLVEFRKKKFQGALFERAQGLSKDPDYDVRKIMATEVIYKICQNIPTELIEIFMLEKALQLVYDAEINVKTAGIRLIFDIIPFLSQEEQKNRLVKIFTELVSSTTEEVIQVMSSVIGKALQHLQHFILINQQYMQLVLQSLKDYSKHDNDQVRINFAYNFPGIIKITDLKIFNRFKAQYIKMIESDPCIEVQTTLISSIHEIAEILGPEEAYKLFEPIITKLFKSNEPQIYATLVHRIEPILRSLRQNDKEKFMDEEVDETKDFQQNNFFAEITQFQNYIIEIKDWRMKVVFYKQIANMIDLFDLQSFYEQFLPVMQQNFSVLHCSISNLEVRASIINVIIQYIYNNYILEDTSKIIQNLIQEFKNSNSYKKRIVFIEFFYYASLKFSRYFFQKYNLLCILDLFSDKVPNVQIKLYEILERVRYLIDDDDEKQEDLLENFNKLFKKIPNNKDKEALKVGLQAMKRIEQIDFLNIPQFIEEDHEKHLHEQELEMQEKEYNEKKQHNNSSDDFDYDFKTEIFSGFNYQGYKKRFMNTTPNIYNHKRRLRTSQSQIYNKLPSIKQFKYQQTKSDKNSIQNKKFPHQKRTSLDIKFDMKTMQMKYDKPPSQGEIPLQKTKDLQQFIQKNSVVKQKLPQIKTNNEQKNTVF